MITVNIILGETSAFNLLYCFSYKYDKETSTFILENKWKEIWGPVDGDVQNRLNRLLETKDSFKIKRVFAVVESILKQYMKYYDNIHIKVSAFNAEDEIVIHKVKLTYSQSEMSICIDRDTIDKIYNEEHAILKLEH